MEVIFFKYQGTGNDFIMLDNLDGKYNDLTISDIVSLCDRRFGIGADGLIRINAHPGCDFEVDYFNSDGSKSFCGNGARCSVAFAETLGIPVSESEFHAIDGKHKAYKKGDQIKLEMCDVSSLEKDGDAYVLDTGSPHFVKLVQKLDDLDIVQYGRNVRYSDSYAEHGINVNLMEEHGNGRIHIATYERGVEDETLSCGTGATACALVYGALHGGVGTAEVQVAVKGGELLVGYQKHADGKFTNVTLTGPAEYVFSGKIIV